MYQTKDSVLCDCYPVPLTTGVTICVRMRTYAACTAMQAHAPPNLLTPVCDLTVRDQFPKGMRCKDQSQAVVRTSPQRQGMRCKEQSQADQPNSLAESPPM